MKFKFINKLIKDVDYRNKTILLLSIIFNLSYSLLLLIESRLNFSHYFIATSIYYALVSILKFFILIKTNQKNKLTIKEKLCTLRNCGWILLFINFIVSLLAFVLIFISRTVVYHEIIVITMATYTFTTLSFAIIGSVKAIRQHDYVLSAQKLTSLVSASVSIIMLTDVMLSIFGAGDLALKNVMLPLVCVLTFAFIYTISILTIYKTNLKLRKLEKNEKN